MTPAPLTRRRILAFWLPLAGTWLMMAAEGPYLAAIIARLPEPTANLAAFGVAFAFAIIIESPVFMLMSASTALVEDEPSYRALRRFAYRLAALVTAVQVVLLLPPVFDAVAGLLRLPADVAHLTHGALVLLLPWPGAIAYRRFRQGILIRHGQTRRVATGTVIRLAAMSVTAFAAFRAASLPGVHVGALALSAGVLTEAVASRLMTRGLVASLRDRPRPADAMEALRPAALARFYAPLGLTTFVALSAQPIVTFFMGQARFPIESLAVLPVIHGLTFVFRALGLSFLEVVITLLGRRREHFAELRDFAFLLALAATGGLMAIAFTPLAEFWFHTVSGLDLALTRFALLPVRILSVFPALSVVLHVQRGLLVHARRTRPTTTATVLEVVAVSAVLAAAIHALDFPGAVAAATAILAGRLVGVAWLVPPCLRLLRAEPTP
ncbi:MAG: hypothetical protein OXH69_24085 [Acidobacteria bacterium]|nr:hypothetical protein [Acidobacteriota bacterium]